MPKYSGEKSLMGLKTYTTKETLPPPRKPYPLSRRRFLKLGLGTFVGVMGARLPLTSSTPELEMIKDLWGIEVVGPSDFINTTQRALSLLKNSSYWESHVQLLEKIVEAEITGVQVQEPVTYGVDEPTWKASDIWYAGTIVHDAHHVKLYQEAVRDHGVENVEYEMWAGVNGETLCLQVQLEVLLELKADSYIISYIQGFIENGPTYQNTPYPDRNW